MSTVLSFVEINHKHDTSFVFYLLKERIRRMAENRSPQVQPPMLQWKVLHIKNAPLIIETTNISL